MICIPGVCNGNPETTVAAHSNQQKHGKGVGHKSDDCFIAFACSACHDAIDGRAGRLAKEDRHEHWEIGYIRTMRYLFSRGLVKP